MSDEAQKLAEDAVREVASALGLKVDAAQVVALGAQAVAHIGDLITAKAWRDAKASGQAAAAKITTLEEAETSARSPR